MIVKLGNELLPPTSPRSSSSSSSFNAFEAAAVTSTLRRLREENVALSLALGSAQSALNRANDEMIEKRILSLKRMEESKADAAERITSVEKELSGARAETRRLSKRAKQLEDELRASISDLNSAQADVKSLRSELEAAKRDAVLVTTSVSPRKIAVALVERWKETSLIDTYTSSSGKTAASVSVSSQSQMSTTSKIQTSNPRAFTGLTLPLGPVPDTTSKPAQVTRLLSKWTSTDVFSKSSSSLSSPTSTTMINSVKSTTTTTNNSPRSPLSLHRPSPVLPTPVRFSSSSDRQTSTPETETSRSPLNALSLQTQVDLLNLEVEKNGRTMGPLLVQLSEVLDDLHKAEEKIANDNYKRRNDRMQAAESAALIARLERSQSEMLLRVVAAEERANEAELINKEYELSASSEFLKSELLRRNNEYSIELTNISAELKNRSEDFQITLAENINLQRLLQTEIETSNELRDSLEASVSKQSALKTQLATVLERLDDAFAKLAHTETSRADEAQHSSNELELATAVRQTMHELLENEERNHAKEIANALDKQRLTELKFQEEKARAERAEKKIAEIQIVSDRVYQSVEELQRRLSLSLDELTRRNNFEAMLSQLASMAKIDSERLHLELQNLSASSSAEIHTLKCEIVRLKEHLQVAQGKEKELDEAIKNAASARIDANIEKSARLTLASSHAVEISTLTDEILSLTKAKDALLTLKDEEIRALSAAKDGTISTKDEESRRLYEALADSAERINVLRKKLAKAEERIQELQILAHAQKIKDSSSSGSAVSSSDWFSIEREKKRDKEDI